MKKAPIFLFSIILFAACSGQSTAKREIYNADFKWTITVPEGFETVDPEEWARIRNKGTAAVENAAGQKVDDQTTGIFVFKSGERNYFEANYQPFDEAVDGPHIESIKAVNELTYQTFMTQLPGIKIDSARSVQKIDGLEFHVSKMKIEYPNRMTMWFDMHSRLFGKRELTVNLIYFDEKKGQQMRKSWERSKFGK